MAQISNQGSVTNLAGNDMSIGMLLKQLPKQYASDGRLAQQNNYYPQHDPDPDPLKLGTAREAAFNAEGKDNDPYCLPGTRTQVLQQIRTWADGKDPNYIFWLSGWAGTGKSTIARTIAREYFDKRCFMASFFFVRGGGDVSHAKKFVRTIASQLAQRNAVFKSLLVLALLKDPSIRGMILKDQWKGLILQPLCELNKGSFPTPLLLIIDNLDECEEKSHIRLILHLLSDSEQLQKLRCRVLITSRPDIPVQSGFSQIPEQNRLDFVLHNDELRPSTNGDISIFLRHGFAEIQRNYTLDETWPGQETIKHLVRKAGGLFIWADTVCRFVDKGGHLIGPDRLSNILKGDTSKPEEELDKIYIQILESNVGSLSPCEKDKVYEMLRETLGAIITLFSQLPALSIARLLDMQEKNVRNVLGGLHSILDIPKSGTQPVRLHHPSLRDFLLSSERCSNKNFWILEKVAHKALADHCIQLMSQKLGRNIFCLEDPSARVPPQNVADYLPEEVQYACRYWVDHLKRSEHQLCDESSVHCFLRNHLLHWIEALAWMEQTSEGIHAIASLQSMVNVSYPQTH